VIYTITVYNVEFVTRWEDDPATGRRWVPKNYVAAGILCS